MEKDKSDLIQPEETEVKVKEKPSSKKAARFSLKKGIFVVVLILIAAAVGGQLLKRHYYTKTR